jgi:hypothetical protein
MEEEKLTPEKAESLIRYFSKYGELNEMEILSFKRYLKGISLKDCEIFEGEYTITQTFEPAKGIINRLRGRKEVVTGWIAENNKVILSVNKNGKYVVGKEYENLPLINSEFLRRIKVAYIEGWLGKNTVIQYIIK